MASMTNQVARDLQAKIKLEGILRPKVNELFKRMVNAHVRSVATTGMPLNAQVFKQEWEDLLLAHYELVQVAFNGSVEAFQVKQMVEVAEPTNEELLTGALLLWREQQAPRQAEFITTTNFNNVADAMAQARESLLADGESLDNRTVAATSGAILGRSMAGRTGSIVMTETQSAAESTKNLEAYSLSDIDPAIALGGSVVVSTTTKNWQTAGDNDVRSDHKLANGQVRQLGEAFDVGGERLRHPGDSGLGATMKNLAGCRCSAIYRI